MKFEPVKFQKFIQQKYADWRGDGRATLGEFAAHVGVISQTMSFWYNGGLKKRPTQDKFELLVNLYGIEAYEAVNIELPITIGPPIIFHVEHMPAKEELAVISEECEDYLDSIPGLTRSQRQEKLIECYVKKGFILLSKG